MNAEILEIARRWPNQTEIAVTGRHFAQEDNSDEIGHGIAIWLQSLSIATR